MSVISWVGNANKVAQVNSFTFAGTFLAAETVTITYGTKSYVYTLASGTIATFLPLLVTAYNALTAQEFAEQTASATSPDFKLTADTAGKAFIVTIATDSVSGTIDGGASSGGVATVANSGPDDASVAVNYSGGALPVNSDTLNIDRPGTVIRHGLSALSGVTLTARNITAPDVEIGLPETNADGTAYPEYRPTYFACGVTSDYVNASQAGRIKLDYGSVQTAYRQDASGTGAERDIPAVLLKGSSTSNTFEIVGGECGLGFASGETAKAATLQVSGGAKVSFGRGGSGTLTTVKNYGATLDVYCAVATKLWHVQTGRYITTIYGTGAVAAADLQGGTVDYRTTGALGGATVVMGNDAALIFDGDQRAKTVTNYVAAYSSAVRVSDVNGVVNSGVLRVDAINCRLGTLGTVSGASIVVTKL